MLWVSTLLWNNNNNSNSMFIFKKKSRSTTTPRGKFEVISYQIYLFSSLEKTKATD